MKCFKCASNMQESFTTDVTDLGSCLVIVRNVPSVTNTIFTHSNKLSVLILFLC